MEFHPQPHPLGAVYCPCDGHRCNGLGCQPAPYDTWFEYEKALDNFEHDCKEIPHFDRPVSKMYFSEGHMMAKWKLLQQKWIAAFRIFGLPVVLIPSDDSIWEQLVARRMEHFTYWVMRIGFDNVYGVYNG